MALGTRYSLKVTIVAAVAGMVGIVAAVMGFSAERKRITADKLVWIENENRCLVPANQTVSLSIMAGFLVLVMQISLTVAGGCLCCNYRINKFSDPAPLAIKSLILSWASSIVASIFFFYGAGVTANHHARTNSSPLPMATSASCGYAINAGVFAGGAIIALLATASAISYYLAVARIDMIWSDHSSKPNAGLETGHRSPAPPATHTTQ